MREDEGAKYMGVAYTALHNRQFRNATNQGPAMFSISANRSRRNVVTKASRARFFSSRMSWLLSFK